MQRLTYIDRQLIERGLKLGKTRKWIAQRLSRDYSVIKREINRNSGDYLPYSADSAQRIADRRAKKTNVRKIDKDPELKKYITERLRDDDWSPEQIAGTLKEQLPPKVSSSLSHESIYQYLYQDQGARAMKLWQKLKTRRKARRPKGSRKYRSVQIKERVSVHERPKVVKEKKRHGDWETDMIVFDSGKKAIQVIYERKSQFCILNKLPDKTADNFESALRQTREKYANLPWFSVTRDNGSENTLHYQTRDEFKLKSYFCDTYCSWQKGGVENCNKLIRWYLPKNESFENISRERLSLVQKKLNNRPRKKLNYLTPKMVLDQCQHKGALNP
jgi:IS30 family transposase